MTQANDQPEPASAAPVEQELGPLPEPQWRGPAGTGSYFDGFTADQMRIYASAAVAAERERCLADCDAVGDLGAALVAQRIKDRA